MRVLYWNIRGLGRSKAKGKLYSLVKAFIPTLVWIFEPKIRVKYDSCSRLRLPGMNKKIIHNSTKCRKGNIWIMWSASINDPVVISNFPQAITVDVRGHLVTGVHAASLTIHRRSLWENLSYEMIKAPKTGLEYSWCNNKVGVKRILCLLDIALYNVKWLEAYPSRGYKIGTRGTSDHSPIFGGNANLPKPTNIPFRALKVWMTHESFRKVIEDAWNTEVRGNPVFFSQQTKKSEKDNKRVELECFGDVKKNLQEADEEVMKASLMSDRNPEDIVLLNQLVTARGKQEVITQQKHEKQKARVKWLREGASNTKFFHFTAKEVNFSEDIFDVVPRVITDEDNVSLESIPSEEEIKKAAFELNPDSSPGPDGFGGWFYRMSWDIVGADFVRAIQYCWTKEFIPACMDSNFLMLLPKVKNARKPNQFRPIGLMNFSFKVITKIITSRLIAVVDKVVSPQQGAFIKGRNIQEKIVLASKMVNELETKRRGGNVGLKLDISQAYDSLIWDFLFHTLKSFGFYGKFINWIHILLNSAMISVLINGGPAWYFKVRRGLRQDFPDRYLGVMLTPGSIRSKHIWGCVEMLQENLAGWKGKLLSFQERLILMKFVLCSIPIYNISVKATRITEIFFTLPVPSFYLICCDGTSRGNPGADGYGFIYRKGDDAFVFALSGGIGVATNFMAEVMAVICAGEWAMQHFIHRVCFRTDSEAVMSAFQSKKIPWWVITRWNNIIAHITEWYFTHSFREIYPSADALSKRGSDLPSGEKRSYNNQPNFITLEAPDCPYYRFS
ncbi:uncharacterized protein LOC113273292 [Papaver somniferum]|uniref:uncharacterized protein LOC113273292 n=1 Tax=Papaver somniferum TaxID=3469 RepID=UPI000E6FFC78|nr:uncharacterized protein LOC113273292 [Papaver somniferum]